ncbi:MAG: response regulator [Desulfobacterales bacterium]|nr:response regulator [Desulfobacterales bacterium]MCF8077964.1 response regulator [Desulfobacterales bacterium]
MGKTYSILVADRNRHVRDYLKRELAAEGYLVRLAKTGREVLHWAFHDDPLDLVIIDPNLSDERDLKVFEKILDRVPQLPVIVHGFSADFNPPPVADSEVSFVEKRGGSIEELKRTVFEMLHPSSAVP